jgi:hypothetical protein
MTLIDNDAGYKQITATLDMPVGSVEPVRARCITRLQRHPETAVADQHRLTVAIRPVSCGARSSSALARIAFGSTVATRQRWRHHKQRHPAPTTRSNTMATVNKPFLHPSAATRTILRSRLRLICRGMRSAGTRGCAWCCRRLVQPTSNQPSR